MHAGTGALLVGLGGFAGSVARYGLALLGQRVSFDWPLGTLAANVLGCLAIGVLAALSARSAAISPEARLLLATGFCGGFTTMSSMVYETARMLRGQEYLHASLYLAGTLVLSMLAFAAGAGLVRLITRGAGGPWN